MSGLVPDWSAMCNGKASIRVLLFGQGYLLATQSLPTMMKMPSNQGSSRFSAYMYKSTISAASHAILHEDLDGCFNKL